MDSKNFEILKQKVENGLEEQIDINLEELTKRQLKEYRNAQVCAMAKKSEVIVISLSAEAYYSGATYEEEVVLLSKDFIDYIYETVDVADSNSIKEDEECSVYVGELDGKHSETYGSIYIETYNENELPKLRMDKTWDGYYLERYLFGSNYDLKQKCKDNLMKRLESVDTTIEVTVKIKKSQKSTLDNFVEMLHNEK